MKKNAHPAAHRSSSTVTLKDALRTMLKSYHLDGKFDETNLAAHWREIMGKAIANRTTNLYIRNEVMIVTLNSAALKHEMNNSKEKVLDLLEKHCGRKVVRNVLFI